MEITPAPLLSRLERAGRLVKDATSRGARLVVLPELFNYGYRYCAENYQRAEPPNGPTHRWLLETSAHLKAHLAGSWLVRDGDEIFNRLTLASPDGRIWQYDKNYPWAWERAYFRGRRKITVATTDLGRIGMLLCWDVAHPGLWRQYAGQVDLMLIASCPPDASRPTYHLPGGEHITFDDLGPIMRGLKPDGKRLFLDGVQKQTAWLNVPCVNSSGCGEFHSNLPCPTGSLLLITPFAPWLLKYIGKAKEIHVQCAMIPAARILSGDGQILAQAAVNQGEDYLMTEVELPDSTPIPATQQPRRIASWLSYFIADTAVPWLTAGEYQRNKLCGIPSDQ